MERSPRNNPSICTETPERFTLGTYAGIVTGDGDLCVAVLDEKTSDVFPFGRWEGAARALAEMRANPDDHGYFPLAWVDLGGFTPAEPGVDTGRAS